MMDGQKLADLAVFTVERALSTDFVEWNRGHTPYVRAMATPEWDEEKQEPVPPPTLINAKTITVCIDYPRWFGNGGALTNFSLGIDEPEVQDASILHDVIILRMADALRDLHNLEPACASA